MPTLRFNTVQGGMFNSPAAGGLFSTTSTSGGDTHLLGTTTVAGSNLYVFKGTPPSDFSSFTSLSTRLSDLLVAIPLLNSSVVSTTTSNIKYLVATGSATSRTMSFANTTGNLVRSSNVVTASATLSGTSNGLVPGQVITISGVTNDTSFNGTFAVASIIPASPGSNSTSLTFNQTGPDASKNGTGGTITISYQAIQSGEASWFCICRTSGTWTVASAFTGFGAVIGNVGVTGSGADLEIVSTTITAGSNYTSAGMYFNVPLNWTL